VEWFIDYYDNHHVPLGAEPRAVPRASDEANFLDRTGVRSVLIEERVPEA
jgi:hypothetical protein